MLADVIILHWKNKFALTYPRADIKSLWLKNMFPYTAQNHTCMTILINLVTKRCQMQITSEFNFLL